MKKSLVLALVAVLVLSFASMAFAFTDVPDWAKTQVDKLAEMKIVDGSAAKFNSTDSVSRAEFAKMIVVAKGLALENPTKATFSDVATDDWSFPYIEAAVKAGYIEGVGNGKFDPKESITREQIAKIIVIAAGKKADATKALNFDDKASIADWAKGYVAVAADLKLMQGSNNKFAPKANATRAEAAVLIYNELVYEGKITVAIASDMITDVKYVDTYTNIVADADPDVVLSAITVGGKRYEVDSKVIITVDGNEVNGFAVRENTHGKITIDKDDAVTKLELSSTDYKYAKAKVEALGKAGATTFAVIGGKKVNYDDGSDNYASVNSDLETVAKTAPIVGKTYVYFLDDRGFGYYFENVDDATVKGTVEYVGKDSKVYLFVDGKKYLADATSTSDNYNGAATPWSGLAGKYVEFSLDSGDYIDGTTIVVSDVLSGYVADRPVLIGNATDGWDVYIKVAKEATNNKYNNSDYFWLHYNALDVIDDNDVPDHALQFDTAAHAAVYGYDVTTGLKVLEKYAGVYINGASKNLAQVSKRSFVVVKFKEAGKYNSVDFYSAYAAGRVEKITKDGNNNVTKVTIGGKEFTYVGQSASNTTTDEGQMWIATSNALGTVAVDDLVTGAVNTNGELVTIITTYNGELINEGTVTAIGGGKSVMSKNSSDADIFYVPANTIEVKYTDGGVTKIAWLSYAWMSGKGTDGNPILGFMSDTDADRSYDSGEVGLTGIFKANAGVAFSSIKVGDVIDFDTTDAVANTGKESGLAKFIFDVNSTATLTDSDYDFSNIWNGTGTSLDGAYYYTVDAYLTNDDTTAPGADNYDFSSTPALFINVR